jgi:hypothetical protein
MPSRVVCGTVIHDDAGNRQVAEYHVHVTDGPMHVPHVGFYITFGRFGAGSAPSDRYAVALDVAATPSGLEFAVFDADTAPIANDPDVGRALRGAEVAGTPLADVSIGIVRLAFEDDPRLAAFAAGVC